MAKPPNITAEDARQLLRYNRTTGTLTWKKRIVSMFVDDDYWSAETKCRRWNSLYAGKIAGSLSDGYIRVRMPGSRPKAHQLIWLMVHGVWPKDQIDHRNGDGSANNLSNLREATSGQNAQNRRTRITSRSGFTGVSWDKRSSNWRAEICAHGKDIYLGNFGSKESARDAYLAAKLKYHFFQPRPREAA